MDNMEWITWNGQHGIDKMDFWTLYSQEIGHFIDNDLASFQLAQFGRIMGSNATESMIYM